MQPDPPRIAFRKSGGTRKIDTGKDHNGKPARSTLGKSTAACLLPPIASRCAAVRGFRIAGSAHAEGMSELPPVRKTGACTSCISTAAARQPPPASRRFCCGASANNLHVRTMDKSSLTPHFFRAAEYITPLSTSTIPSRCRPGTTDCIFSRPCSFIFNSELSTTNEPLSTCLCL